ncbi:MAG: hypothetical protein AAFY76_01040, partial [Cyanobacteria bacterium J06649_11]
MRSIKIPNVRVIESAEDSTRKFRELNFWREEEDEEYETLVCIYISPHGKYLKSDFFPLLY